MLYFFVFLITVNQKIDIPVKVDLDIKKTLKKKGKKTPKI